MNLTERFARKIRRGVISTHMHKGDAIAALTTTANSLAPNNYLVLDFISNQNNQFEKEWLVDTLSELGLVNTSCSDSNSHRVSVMTFHKPTDRSLYFATGNPTKVLELQSKCETRELHLANIDVKEIKSDDIVEIAKDKARKSYEHLKHPVVVTDGGIFINALNGFPGANSKQAATLLGPQKLIALLEGEADRTAVRRNCMVFFDGETYKVCVAEVPLLISEHVTESDHEAYPMDTILIPVHDENPHQRTYKQMPVHERVRFTELPIFERFIATL